MSTPTRAVAAAGPVDRPHTDPAPGRRHAAANVSSYIADMCAGLIDMAEAAELDVLAYILGMARLEAELQNRKATPPSRRRRQGSGAPRAASR